jgi:hypothetical protein
MSEEKKYGIDLVKKVIKFLYDTTIEGIDDLKDKKLSLGEILGLSDNVYSAISLVTKFDDIKNQILDVDSEEGIDLAEYVASLIGDTSSDTVNVIVTNAVAVISSEIEIYQKNIVPIIEKIKS